MDRTRVCAATLIAAAVLTAVSGIPGTADAPRRGLDGELDSERIASAHEAASDWLLTAVVDQQACKPSAPIVVELTPVGPGGGGTLDVDVAIEPMAPFAALTWSARCEGAVRQVDGPRSGSVVAAPVSPDPRAAPAQGRVERVRLDVTPDEPAAFVVRVEGVLVGGEQVALRRMVRWGAELPASGSVSEPIEPGLTPSVTTLPTRPGR